MPSSTSWRCCGPPMSRSPSADVAERLEAQRGWSLATVKTMLSTARRQGRHLPSRRRPALPLFARHRARSLCRQRVPAFRRPAVRRPPVAAGRAPRRRGCARRRRHRRDRGPAEGAQVVTDWLLGTLLATSGLIVLVLLVREPVRRAFRCAGRLWPVADPRRAAADADADRDGRAAGVGAISRRG